MTARVLGGGRAARVRRAAVTFLALIATVVGVNAVVIAHGHGLWWSLLAWLFFLLVLLAVKDRL